MNVKLKEVHGWRLLWRIVVRPEIYPRIFDDRYTVAPSPRLKIKSKVRAIAANPENHVFAVRVKNKLAGCFVLCSLGGGRFEVHTLLTSDFHGLMAVTIGRFATRFGLDLPYVKMLSSYCPDNMPETYLFARMCGWKNAGIYPLKWMVKGVEYAMRAVKIEKGDLPCRS